MEGVIGVRDEIEGRAIAQFVGRPPKKIEPGQGIVRPLQKQHGNNDVGEVLGPRHRGLARRVKGKREEDQAHDAGQGAIAWAWDVIRPPKDRPPANSGTPSAKRNASAAAARTVACARGGLSVRLLPFSMYGN